MDPLAVQVSRSNGPDSAPGLELEITDVAYDSDAQTIDVTWESVPGVLYFIWGSTDGETWEDIDDGFESEGSSTTFPGSATNNPCT